MNHSSQTNTEKIVINSEYDLRYSSGYMYSMAIYYSMLQIFDDVRIHSIVDKSGRNKRIPQLSIWKGASCLLLFILMFLHMGKMRGPWTQIQENCVFYRSLQQCKMNFYFLKLMFLGV